MVFFPCFSFILSSVALSCPDISGYALKNKPQSGKKSLIFDLKRSRYNKSNSRAMTRFLNWGHGPANEIRNE